MDKKILFSECDVNLNKIILKKDNPSKSFIKNYNSVFNDIYELFDYTPSQLLNIAKKEENPDSNQYICEIKHRKVSEVQVKYYEFLSDNDYSENTKKLKLSIYRNFLNECGIEKPKTISFEVSNHKNKELSMYDIFKSLNLCSSPRDKAIVCFALSSGINLSSLIKLKISDLINACESYFHENEIHSIENILTKNPEGIIPSWNVNDNIFFSTPESTFFIFEYLKTRNIVNTDEILFKSQKGNQLNPDSVTNMFFKLNRKLGSESDNHNNYGKFRFTNLRKFFEKICEENDINPNVTIKEEYFRLIPYLTINSINREKFLKNQIKEKDL